MGYEIAEISNSLPTHQALNAFANNTTRFFQDVRNTVKLATESKERPETLPSEVAERMNALIPVCTDLNPTIDNWI